MQSSTFHQSQSHSTGTRLSLAKFSYTTTPVDHPGPLSWSHINGLGDLACVFDKLTATESSSLKLIMKVTRGDSILEQIDIARLVQSNLAQSTSVPKSSFAVVIKSPCLAVKYPQNGLIRRFQLKFLAERDFYTALALLSEINCPFTEGNATTGVQQPPRRPPSSSSWASFQAPGVAWRSGNTAMTPESNATGISHPKAQWSGGLASLNIPSPTPYITPNTILPTDKELGEARKMSQLSDLQRAPTNQVSSLVQPAVDLPNPSSQPSTVEGYRDIQELNQVLPPRRELPFLKPGMKRKRPELTTETIAERPKSSRASKSASQAHCNTIERCDTMISNASSQSLVQTQVYVEPAEPVSTQPYSQPDKEIQHQGPNSRLTTTLCAAVPRDTSNNVQVERTQSPIQPAAPASIEEELTAYLSSPSSERVRFLENWMCELINDDRFMTLCQDVEATWKRFAFGIKK